MAQRHDPSLVIEIPYAPLVASGGTLIDPEPRGGLLRMKEADQANCKPPPLAIEVGGKALTAVEAMRPMGGRPWCRGGQGNVDAAQLLGRQGSSLLVLYRGKRWSSWWPMVSQSLSNRAYPCDRRRPFQRCRTHYRFVSGALRATCGLGA